MSIILKCSLRRLSLTVSIKLVVVLAVLQWLTNRPN